MASKQFHKVVEDYYAERLKKINHEAKEYLESKDKKALHKLRVEIKKLTALLHLTQYLHADFDSKKALKPFGKIFKLCGKLRDYDNEKELSKKYKMGESWFEKNHQKQARTFSKLKQKRREFHHRLKHPGYHSSKLILRLSTEDISKYIQKLHSQIKKGLKPQLPIEHLHALRKQMKEIVYLAELTGKTNINSGVPVNLYDLLQDTIGKCNDLHIFEIKVAPHVNLWKKRSSFERLKNDQMRLLAKIDRLLKAGPGLSI